jgi:hypothetical protein
VDNRHPGKTRGSILIVVLGLLAILAVVGITFVTMSSIDRSTASNFALQSQFDLMADGTLDYICHHLVGNVWEVHTPPPSGKTEYTMTLLARSYDADKPPRFCNYPGMDDYGATTATDIMCNNWLCSSLEPSTLSPTHWSFKGPGPGTPPYGLSCFDTNTLPPGADLADNIGAAGLSGTGTAGVASSGVWVPELTVPYETGLFRVSPTVLDNAALINLNAHGNKATWNLNGATGMGYFISDVDPAASGVPGGVDIFALLQGKTISGTGDGGRSKMPGLWGTDTSSRPNDPAGWVTLENPNPALTLSPAALGINYPFSLDDEFELRRTPPASYPTSPDYWPGRLRFLAPNIFSGTNRLAFTTVGWTSEAMGDWYPPSFGQIGYHNLLNTDSSGNPSLRKADLNYDTQDQIYNALRFARAVPSQYTTAFTWTPQFIVNIMGFRDGGTGCGIRKYTIAKSGGDNTNATATAASRQPIFSKVQVGSMTTTGSTYNWDVKVEVISPWPNDTAAQAAGAGLTTSDTKVEVVSANCTVTYKWTLASGGAPTTQNLPTLMHDPPNQTNRADYVTISLTQCTSTTLSNHLTAIKLHYTGQGADVILDQIDNPTGGNPSLTLAADAKIKRPIYWQDEGRGSGDPSPVRAVYVGPWIADATGAVGTFALETGLTQTSGIPIRFPRSSDGTSSNLPPRATEAGKPFKAIARLGDLDQVLCFRAAVDTDQTTVTTENPGTFWPWLPRIAKAGGATALATLDKERLYKFDWLGTDPWSDPLYPSTTLKAYHSVAANVLAVGGPWNDKIDNDNDGVADDDDKGLFSNTSNQGRFGGPETRVAGRVNMYTMTTLTAKAIEGGVGISGLNTWVSGSRSSALTTTPPMKSPADLLTKASLTVTTNAPPTDRNLLEGRDAPFTRVSNILTVRSDTFTVYATVQYGMVKGSTFTPLRSRRFWAVIDRSPCLARPPLPAGTPPNPSPFIRPRILNFQWLN